MRCFGIRLVCMSAGSLNGAFYKDTKHNEIKVVTKGREIQNEGKNFSSWAAAVGCKKGTDGMCWKEASLQILEVPQVPAEAWTDFTCTVCRDIICTFYRDIHFYLYCLCRHIFIQNCIIIFTILLLAFLLPLFFKSSWLCIYAHLTPVHTPG